jgi:hypothetical protein
MKRIVVNKYKDGAIISGMQVKLSNACIFLSGAGLFRISANIIGG